MVSSETSNEIFNNLQKDVENRKCIECSMSAPTFTSVNHGCFICSNCIQSHLALGQEISRVKSMAEQWTTEDLKLMTAGGNSALKEFFNHYSLSDSPPRFKYCTRAAFFYREMLSVVASDQVYEQNCPGIDEGRELVVSSYPDLPPVIENRPEEVKMSNYAPFIAAQGERKQSPWSLIRSAFCQTVDAGNRASRQLSEKINKFAEKPAVKKAEAKTKEIAGKIESKLNDVINTVKSKPIVQSTVSEINSATDSFAREVKFTYTKINSNPSVNKLKENTMNLLRDMGIVDPSPPMVYIPPHHEEAEIIDVMIPPSYNPPPYEPPQFIPAPFEYPVIVEPSNK